MIALLADGAALSVLLGLYAYEARARPPFARAVLAITKTVPVCGLVFVLGPQGGGLLVLVIAVFAHALTQLHAAPAGRAHLVAGLSAGALFASGPFGSVFVGATLLALIFSGSTRPLGARLADIAIILFVPLVVIIGFSIAAQAQTGDPFALASDSARTLSPLSVWIAHWPASLIAAALLPCLAPNIWTSGHGTDGRAPRALFGGALAAIVTFGGSIDGVLESALLAGLAANAAPVRTLKSMSFLFLLAGGACAFMLCVFCTPASRATSRVPYIFWHIGQPPLDAPPPWGIDLAP